MAETSEIADWRIDQIKEGQSAEVEVRIGEADVDAFAALSGDVSPLHMDDAFARRRGFRGRVVHGALLSSHISRLLGVYLPGRNSLLQSLNLRFIEPVYVGDAINGRVAVTQISVPLRTVALEVTMTNVATGTVVARGRAQVGLTDEKDDHE